MPLTIHTFARMFERISSKTRHFKEAMCPCASLLPTPLPRNAFFSNKLENNFYMKEFAAISLAAKSLQTTFLVIILFALRSFFLSDSISKTLAPLHSPLSPPGHYLLPSDIHAAIKTRSYFSFIGILW